MSNTISNQYLIGYCITKIQNHSQSIYKYIND